MGTLPLMVNIPGKCQFKLFDKECQADFLARIPYCHAALPCLYTRNWELNMRTTGSQQFHVA
jgi:hypothetical protein